MPFFTRKGCLANTLALLSREKKLIQLEQALLIFLT
jgi:hypothetical protein